MNYICPRCLGCVGDQVRTGNYPLPLTWCKCVPRTSTPEELYRLAQRQMERQGKEIKRLRARLKGRGETVKALLEEIERAELERQALTLSEFREVMEHLKKSN